MRQAKKQKRKRKRLDLSPEARSRNPFNVWIGVFSSRIGCFLSGVLTASGRDLRSGFKDMLLMQYQNALLSTRMILSSILYQDKIVGHEIKKQFLVDVVFPYYFELIYRFDNLFSDELFSRLSALKQQAEITPDSRRLLKELFRSLYVIQPHALSLRSGMERALDIERDLRKLSPDMVRDNLRRLNENIDFIFGRFYPRLFSLMEYFYRQEDRGRRTPLREFIGLRDEDAIGFYTNRWKEELAVESRKEAEERKKAESRKIPKRPEKRDEPDENDPIRRGLRIIEENVLFHEILAGYFEKKDTRAYFPVKDKVFLTYALTDFFDKEFSFLFTSNKATITVTFSDGKRVDMKAELTDIYYRISTLFEKSNEYLKIIKELRKLDEDAYMTIQERSARSNQFSLQRSQLSRTMRKEAKDIFDEFSKKFLALLSDSRRDRKILQNPDSKMEFNKKIDGDRYAHGKTVIEAFQDGYSYASAMTFLLADGDLSGFSLMLEKPVYLTPRLESDGF